MQREDGVAADGRPLGCRCTGHTHTNDADLTRLHRDDVASASGASRVANIRCAVQTDATVQLMGRPCCAAAAHCRLTHGFHNQSNRWRRVRASRPKLDQPAALVHDRNAHSFLVMTLLLLPFIAQTFSLTTLLFLTVLFQVALPTLPQLQPAS